MNAPLDQEQIIFLRALLAKRRAIGRTNLPFVSREQDRARQQCKKLGLAKYGKRQADKVHGWWITQKGYAALGMVE